MYHRIIEQILPPTVSCFLFGPRQCGKTTILKKLDSRLYINLLNSKLLLKYTKDPSILYAEVEALTQKQGLIIIDEIQKVPGLLDEVQRCMDDFSELIFILSGSSARKLRRGGANLLGGRAANLSLFPLSMKELANEFILERALKFGTLPKICTLLADKSHSSVKLLLNSYVTTYLTEEVKAEALVRNLDYFQRFLEVAAHQFARETNMLELADQAQISASSANNYFGILEDTLLGFFLHPYATSVRKQLTKTPKFYFFDNGVTRAIKGMISAEVTNQEEGLLYEQLLIQEFVRINSYYHKNWKLNFWKTIGGAEVDLIVSFGNKPILAVEFKASPYPRTRDLSGLLSFREEYPSVPIYLCAPVDQARLIGETVKVLPPKDLIELAINLVPDEG